MGQHADQPRPASAPIPSGRVGGKKSESAEQGLGGDQALSGRCLLDLSQLESGKSRGRVVEVDLVPGILSDHELPSSSLG